MYRIIDKFKNKEIRFLNASLRDTANQASILRFETLLSEDIEEFVTYVEVFENSKKVFIGTVVSVEKSMNSDGMFIISVTCESVLNFLRNRSTGVWNFYAPGSKVESGAFGEIIKNATVDVVLDKLLEHYNYTVENWKKIYKGNITVSGNLDFVADRTNCLDVLLNNIVKQLGGYVIIREDNNKFYLDYLKQPNLTGDNIELAVNLKDISLQNNANGLYSRVYVFGKDRIDIHNVNNGLYYVEDTELLNKIGVIDYVLKLENETDRYKLIQSAKDFLKNQKKKSYSVSINVADKSYISVSNNKFELFQTCKVVNQPLNINENMLIVEMEKDLLQPYLPKLTLNNKTVKQNSIIINSQREFNNYTVKQISRDNSVIINVDKKLENQRKYLIMGV